MKQNLKSIASHVLLAGLAVLLFSLLAGDGSTPGGTMFTRTALAAKSASACTLADSAGDYLVTSQGNAPFATQVSVGLITSDGAGNFSGKSTGSINGNVYQNVTFNGTLTVNSDCTYTSTATDQFGNVSHASGVALNKGEE